MLRRLYINNFRCLENFDLPVMGHSSALLIGKNGSGKSTVGRALEILQKIARGTNRVNDLVKPKDFTRGQSDVPMRFEIEIVLDTEIYEYVIAFELPRGFKELRVFEEKLTAGGKAVYSRKTAQVQLALTDNNIPFSIDWHLVALPIVQERTKKDPLFIFKQWLSSLLILQPIPRLITGESEQETLQPDPSVRDFGAWFTAMTSQYPAAYTKIDGFLKQLMPDLKDIQNPLIGKDSHNLIVQFSNEQGSMKLSFADLSDGEKCFMICALALAANEFYGPLLCFWDEPDNHLSLDEVGHFVLALRKAFQSNRGQFIATSHNSEAILRFSEENTLFLYRKSHLEPTIVRQLSQIQFSGDIINALIRGDVEP